MAIFWKYSVGGLLSFYWSTAAAPNQPFSILRASKSGDQQTLYRSELSFKGVWGSQIVKRSVGLASVLLTQSFVEIPVHVVGEEPGLLHGGLEPSLKYDAQPVLVMHRCCLHRDKQVL